MEDQGFADHGKLGRAKLVFTVMADEDVLDNGFQLCGEANDIVHGAGDGFEFHHDMAEQSAFRGVADGTVVAEFFELANVVEHRSSEEKVDIEFEIVRGDLRGQATEANNVFEQAAEIRVMHNFCGGGGVVALNEGGVTQNGLKKLYVA